MSEFKRGDMVRLRTRFVWSDGNVSGVELNPLALIRSSQVDVPARDIIPDSPALPAVARWLAETEHPDLLRYHLNQAIERYMVTSVFARDMKTTLTIRRMRALIAALEVGRE